jgi:hypothetical protein
MQNKNQHIRLDNPGTMQKELRKKPAAPCFNGGADRSRTDGLIRARDALSQLSYCPIGLSCKLFENIFIGGKCKE